MSNWECAICGAHVVNTELHAQWHTDLEWLHRSQMTDQGQKVSRLFEDRLVEIQESLKAGLTLEQICKEQGLRPASISRSAYRRGHNDIGSMFNRIAPRWRKGQTA